MPESRVTDTRGPEAAHVVTHVHGTEASVQDTSKLKSTWNPFSGPVRQAKVERRRNKINRGGALDVQACHEMMAALPDVVKEVGGVGNREVAYQTEDGSAPAEVTDVPQGADAAIAAKQETADHTAAAKYMAQNRPAAPNHPLRQVYGPYLKFFNVDLAKKEWQGSVLLIYHASTRVPKVTLRTSLSRAEQNIQPKVLDADISSTGYTAVRYDLRIPVEDKAPNRFHDAADVNDPQARHAREHNIPDGNPKVTAGFSQSATYRVDAGENVVFQGGEGDHKNEFTFQVPAMDEPWHWSFYSCNGFSTDTEQPESNYDGVRPLWRDMLQVHSKRPFHLMVGGGDQIYQDDLFFHCKSLREWLDISSSRERESYAFNQNMQIEVERYYLFHYMAHFGQPVVCEAMAKIPSINVIDDHDIFDGFGSYPDGLQNCPVFQALGAIALRAYLLFQHHTTPALARGEDLWGGSTGYNFLRFMGPRTVIFGHDGRYERSKDQVTDPKTYDILFNELLPNLPKSVEHLVFVTGVPVSFPALGLTEKAMEIVSKIRRWTFIRRAFSFSGLYKKLGLSFGEPSNLDDLVDHWNSGFHIKERNTLIERFQAFAEKSSIRVTMIAGDVHCACIAQLRSQSNLTRKTKHVYEMEPLKDHRLMYNIVSSAIGNLPPPKIVLKLFQFSSSRRPLKNVVHTTEGLEHIFQHDLDGKRNKKGHRKIMARRNWCEVDEIISGANQTAVDGHTEPIVCPELACFRLRFEPAKVKLRNKGERKSKADAYGLTPVGIYSVSIPRLVTGARAQEPQNAALLQASENNKETMVGAVEMDEIIADEAVGEAEGRQRGKAEHHGRVNANGRGAKHASDGVAQVKVEDPKASTATLPDEQLRDVHPSAYSLTSKPEPDSKFVDGGAIDGAGVPITRQMSNPWPDRDNVAPAADVRDTSNGHPFGI